MARVEFRLLGTIEAHIDGRPVELGSPRQRAVLAVLLVEAARVVPADLLIDRVWGASPPDGGRPTLSSYISRLRGILAPAAVDIARQQGGYRIDVEPNSVDIHRFPRLLQQARAATDDDRAMACWQQALALWRGEPFADLDIAWLHQIADRLAGQHRAGFADYRELRLRRGEHAELIPDLQAAADASPLDERVAGQLMRALYRAGRQADALHRYEQLRRRLADELGADPAPATRELHHHILTADPDLAAPPATVTAAPAPATVPSAPEHFTGRTVELDQLDACAEGSDPAGTAAVVISGGGGFGKTALATYWAHRVRDRFPDGQLYLNLRGFGAAGEPDHDDPGGHALNPADALLVLLELLRVPPAQIPASVQARAGLYRSRLADTRTLVILDNARDTDQVRPLLPGAPGSMALITSRDQLAGLIAAEGARPVRLDGLDDGEARALLAGRLGAARMAAEPAAVDEIIKACAGLPLALAIVAARAAIRPAFPLAGYAGELADARLDALSGLDPDTDVRAVFSWSYRALRPPAARLFRLLGLHSGPDIGLDAAASLAAVPAPQAHRLLAELTDAHLATEHAPGRYTLHDLLHAYAAERASADEPDSGRAAATERLIDHYLHTAHRAGSLANLGRRPIPLAEARTGTVASALPTRADALAWFGQEHEALLATVHQAASSGFDAHCWRLAWTILAHLDRNGRWRDVVASQGAALAAADRLGDQAMQATSHRCLGLAQLHLGRYQEAHTHLEMAIDLDTRLGGQRELSRSHHAMAMNLERQGRHRDAIAHGQRALSASEAAGDAAGQVRSLNSIGWQHAQLGEHDRAIDYCERALAVPGEQRDGFHAATWDTLGYAHHHLGQYRQAIAGYRRAVALFRDLSNRPHEAECLVHLADSHEALGESAAARDARQRALEIFDEIGHPKADDMRALLGATGSRAGQVGRDRGRKPTRS